MIYRVQADGHETVVLGEGVFHESLCGVEEVDLGRRYGYGGRPCLPRGGLSGSLGGYLLVACGDPLLEGERVVDQVRAVRLRLVGQTRQNQRPWTGIRAPS